MSPSVLNENQQRRVASFLYLLLEDIEQLRTYPGLTESIRRSLETVTECTRQIAEELELPARRDLDVKRRVQVVAEIWAMRSHDIGAAQLRGYGALDPDLTSRLDPLIRQLQSALRGVARAAERNG